MMIALLAAAAVATSGTPAVDLAAAERMYAGSCGERAYATFDDVCNTLKKRLSELKKQEARRIKAEQAAAAKARKTAAVADARQP